MTHWIDVAFCLIGWFWFWNLVTRLILDRLVGESGYFAIAERRLEAAGRAIA